jgi:AcrR family transcriptional regulator
MKQAGSACSWLLDRITLRKTPVISTPSSRRPAKAALSAHEAPPEPGLRERKKAHLRRQIMETATDLFRKRGYENTRVDDIVEILEISQPTFFRYFPSKEDILRQVGRDAYLHITKLLQSERASDATTGERLLRLYVTLCQQIEADQLLWQSIAVSGALKAIRSELRGADEMLLADVLAKILAEGQRRGEITRSFPAEHLAQFMEGIGINVFREWAESPPGSIRITDRIRDAVEFFLRGAKANPK